MGVRSNCALLTGAEPLQLGIIKMMMIVLVLRVEIDVKGYGLLALLCGMELKYFSSLFFLRQKGFRCEFIIGC